MMVTRKSGRTVFAGDDRLAVLRATYKHHLALQWHLLITMEQDLGMGMCTDFHTTADRSATYISFRVCLSMCCLGGDSVMESERAP